MLRVSSKLGD